MTDKRDRQLHPTIGIPGTTWLARNSDFKTPESWCYDNDPRICAEYGRLYSWESARANACPAGWHLPSKAEWIDMIEAVGGYLELRTNQTVGDPKASYAALTTGSFNAVLGGSRTPAGKFIDRAPLDGDGDGMYWTSSSCGGADSVSMIVFNAHSKRILLDCDGSKGWALSVRCARPIH
jgi:uncharacterized protein (TIGR02145 family)